MGDDISSPVQVVVVEDDAITRRALALAIGSEHKLELVAALDSVGSALAWLDQGVPDVLITDLGLPDGSGLDVVRACLSRYPDTSIIVLTISSDEQNVLDCIEAGASGYVLKDAGAEDIARAVLDVHKGGAPMSPVVARMVLTKVRDRSRRVRSSPLSVTTTTPSLTKREAVILDLIAQGDSYGEVARQLSVSVGTVQTHIKNIYGKLAVHSRGEAVFEAHRRGLLRIGHTKIEL